MKSSTYTAAEGPGITHWRTVSPYRPGFLADVIDSYAAHSSKASAFSFLYSGSPIRAEVVPRNCEFIACGLPP